MSHTEIVAYKGNDHDGNFADIDILEGTKEELAKLEEELVKNWEDIDGAKIEIVYRGTDAEAAREAIAGLPRVSEDVVLKR